MALQLTTSAPRTSWLRSRGSSKTRAFWSDLSERQALEAVCSSEKYLNGPAAYNRCRSNQLAMLQRQPERPNLAGLNAELKQSIEFACSTDKYLNGPAAYNSCVLRQIRQLGR